MDRAKAIELLNKALGCLQTDPEDCVSKKCSQCENHATKEDGIEALGMAIKALEQPEIILCKNCLYKRVCSWKIQGAAFCSFAYKEE